MRIESVTSIPLIEPKDRPSGDRGSPDPVAAGTSAVRKAPDPVMQESSLKLKCETDDGKNMVYRLVNDQTGQVISQVPSRQVLNVQQSIEQLLQQEIQKPRLDVKS